MSNTRDIPALKFDSSALHATVETSRAQQSTELPVSTGSEATPSSLAPPESPVQSRIQSGRLVFNSEMPPELEGTVTRIKARDGGSFADVFYGVWEDANGSKMEVAIKCIRITNPIEMDRWQLRIRREVVIWKAAKHPNVLQLLGHKVVDGIPSLISPWCKHGNLLRYLHRNKGTTEAEKLKLLCDAGRGLQYLHSLKPVIAHGDIKPANVLVKDNLEAALCDFGTSRVFLANGTPSGLTTTGNRMGGTAGYQSKERLEELVLTQEMPSTIPGDVYAFGGLILATVSGEEPFYKKKGDHGKIVAVCRGELPLPDDHPKLPRHDPLWGLLQECWSADVKKRPKMSTIIKQLEERRESQLVPQSSTPRQSSVSLLSTPRDGLPILETL